MGEEEGCSSSLGDRRAPSISPVARWRRAGRPSIADIRATHYVRSHSNAPSIAPAVLCRRHPFNSPRMSVPPPSSDEGRYSEAPRRPAARNRSASALQAEPRWMDAKRIALVGEESGRLGFRMAAGAAAGACVVRQRPKPPGCGAGARRSYLTSAPAPLLARLIRSINIQAGGGTHRGSNGSTHSADSNSYTGGSGSIEWPFPNEPGSMSSLG